MNLNKIITIIVALVIVAGIVVACVAGLNVDMKSQEHEQVMLNIDKEYKLSDIMEITKEVFEGKTVDNQKAGSNNKQVLVSAKEITETEKANLVSKINEKYGTTIEEDKIEVTIVPRTKLSSTVNPYIMPIIIIIVLSIVYSAFRYKALGTVKVVLQYLLGLLIIGLLIFSLIALTRLEVGTVTVSALFAGVALSLLAMTSIFERKLKDYKKQKEENK